MPAQYTAIRDSLIARGKPDKEARRIAAATYNKTHKSNPVGPHSDRRNGRKMQRERQMKKAKKTY